MTDQYVTLADGPHRGWTAQLAQVPWQFQIISQTLTAHHPPQLPDLGALRISLSLTIRPGDPQWQVLDAARLRALHPGRREQHTNAAAVAGTLARIHHALDQAADTDRWQVSNSTSGGSARILASAHGIAGANTTVTVQAAAPHPGGDLNAATVRSWHELNAARYGSDRRMAAFGWVLGQIPALPGMPAPDTDWRAQAAAFRDPDEPRIGEITVCFTNAINGRSQRHACADLDEARRLLATTEPPYNNTRTQVFRTVGARGGTAVVEELDAAALMRPGSPAALADAFNPPGQPHRPSPAATPPVPALHRARPGTPPPRAAPPGGRAR